ncbi:MAG: carbohydrate-binding domain-containing protein [Lachnospiraceae bacterium]|nr:carbohydrate-binding domain-containing protein [Lachnospiraceae bacterium]
MRRKIAAISLTVLLTIPSIFGCSSGNKQIDNENNNTTQNNTADSSSDKSDESSLKSVAAVTEIKEEEYDEEDFTRVLVSESGSDSGSVEDGVSILQSTAENTIYLKGDLAETSMQGVNIDTTAVTISLPGIYIITGTLNDGQILVDCQETGTVQLVFYNADISNSTNSPVFIKNCKKTLLVLAENSVNSLSDASEYTYMDAENEEPSACLFSKDDLVICGSGSLTVNGNFNNGIASKDTLKITGGIITVTAQNNAIKGKDCLMITGGSFTVTSKGDGLKSDNSDASLGYVSISDGNFTINSEEDGIQAESMLKVTGGTFDITTGEGAGTSAVMGGNMPNGDIPEGNFEMRDRGKGWDFDNQSSETEDTTSMKGIKAGTVMVISGGSFDIDSKDDAFHSNGTFDMSGGTMLIATGDDGIHADDTLTITDGDIKITQCYEGIESPDIIFNGGTAHIKASDDGINAAGGELTSSDNQNKMGMMSSSTGTLTINNGYIYVNASGDGLDSNGDLIINGGTVIVEGPTDSGNSAIDYEYEFEINGGYLLASGSAGMIESVSSASKQNSVTAFFNSSVNADGIFTVLDSKGELIMAFTPSKLSQCFIFSSTELASGETYTIFTGGSCDGTPKDGLYTEGNYTAGTEFESFTVNESVTTVGSGGMGQNMGGPGGMKNHGGKRDFNGNEMEIPENMEEPPEMPNGAEKPENMKLPENKQNNAENLNNSNEIA